MRRRAKFSLSVPTPFSAYAFHPLDGFFQSLPYHVFIFLFPLHRSLFLALFVFVNFWTILIHDSDVRVCLYHSGGHTHSRLYR